MAQTTVNPDIKQTVPFLAVSNMEASLRFYVDGLGFEITNQWIPGEKIEWCSLKRGNGTLMLQESCMEGFHEWTPGRKVGVGVSIVFTCEDALAMYYEFTEKELEVSEPFVGNGMWVISLKDPDGYLIEFESVTDVPEETRFSEWNK
jgi:catechol 2,3-dioxygenase-like lactoylglutathione lyase family enzyme